METRLLETFVTVAESGSISAAADRLGYVQSSVSEQVQRLERDLGVILLTRTSTGATLTAEGRRLLPAAHQLLAAVGRLRNAVTGARRLRVGSIDTLAVRWLPDLVATLPVEQRPTITTNRRDHLVRDLVDGRCDVALLYRARGTALPHGGPAYHAAVSRLQIEVLGTDDLMVVIAPERAGDADAEWLVTQIGCVHREVFDGCIAPRLGHVRIHAEASTPDTLRSLARQGAGRALLPGLALADDLADGSLVVDTTLPDLGETIEIVAASMPNAVPDVARFLRRVRDHALSPSPP